MGFESDIAFLGAISAFVLVFVTLFREGGSRAAWFFSLGMALIGAEACLGGLSSDATTPQSFFQLQLWKAYIMAFLPGTWFLFSLTYAREAAYFKKFSLEIALSFLLPAALVFFFRSELFTGEVSRDSSGRWLLPLGWAGVGLHFCLLGSWILVLMNLERTVRASVGIMRWQIKYMILGLVTLFVARFYTSSQTVLFRSNASSLEVIRGWALFIACLSIGYSQIRTKPFKINVYPSHTVLSGSIVLLLTGIYLFVMGLLAKVVTWIGGNEAFAFQAFIVLLAFFGFGVMSLSERFRSQIKHWVARHFRRSLYDYRQLWMTFTEKTGSIVDEPQLSTAVTKWISDTFSVLSVTLWLLDDSKKQLRFGASTSMSGKEADRLLLNNKFDPEIIAAIGGQPPVMDLDKSNEAWAETLKKFHPEQFRKGGHRFCIRLMKGDELLGFITLGDRVNGIPYSLEDFEFLKCVGSQVAASIHHIQLSQRLLDAKEMATFQTMSAFFVHDLKNTASTLSLMLQNLPVHFDDPAFRQDALRAIGKSAERLNELIARLTQLRQNSELNLVEAELNEIITASVNSLKTACQAELITDLQPLPKIRLDPEQIQKVVTNLVLNANEASPKGGKITLTTRQQNGWVTLTVTDTGCGMNTEFITRSLFKPFQTTKKKGIGIGLFHTKMIVEAHRGKIEVESSLGNGTTFRVLLPCVGGPKSK